MGLTARFLGTVSAAYIAFSLSLSLNGVLGKTDLDWYGAEVGFLASLKSRVTATPSHKTLIDHIESELNLLGLAVYSDVLNFTYMDQPLSPPKLTVGGQEVAISSYAPYSGNTSFAGIGGKLVDLTGPDDPPDWEKARGNIAVVNVTNSPLDLRQTLAIWPGQPQWYIQTGIPTVTADAKIANLTEAAEAGVKGVVYVWEHITSGNAYGQYVPFKRLYQGVPTIHVAGDAGTAVLQASKNGSEAHLTLSGELIPNTKTRTIWTVVEGTRYKNESIILNTHTDGTNAVEENGHIALLAKAKDLATNPPERTTILVFVTGHMHQPAFSTTGRATSRWLDDNPQYWRGEAGEMTGVASACVEHLGAIDWAENLSTNTYSSAGNLSDEWIYANTPEMVNLLEQNWNGAYPGFVRVNNPIPKGVQSGEGEPLTEVKIPNIALITVPLYLTAEFPENFDERQLIDLHALKRQVDSFMRIWAAMDVMPLGSFGVVPPLNKTTS
ncbi:uncharacterized protein Z518_08548 [Rhinocladiella mackenziei CBS 650.93]|uniref:Peptide hydrolase n=1 Tax=Rhinocladiella mackenziei CBS 650.93 TaxID=1442369 RepID=A0A0D2IH34_9EURO|nr:uncharacterized protein Z518_08548 [Rhinocladiella mackenziei CBS 650.93]KIX02606.1 hypothetical protein Z518_08548 [Rhinocladiella mackenziei CBS 650.93]